MIFTISLPYKIGSGVILTPIISDRNNLFQWERLLQETFPSAKIRVANANGFENVLFFPKLKEA